MQTTDNTSDNLHTSATVNMCYESGPNVNALSFPVTFPTFDAENPHSWFRQVVRIFIVRGISKQNMMFHHTLSELPEDVASQVTHAIDKAPEKELLTTLKSALMVLKRDAYNNFSRKLN